MFLSSHLVFWWHNKINTKINGFVMTYKISTDRRFHVWEGIETGMNVDIFSFFYQITFLSASFSLTLRISVLNSKSPSYQHLLFPFEKRIYIIVSFSPTFLTSFAFKFTKPHNLSGPQPRYLFFPFQFLPFHEINLNEVYAYNDIT